MPTLLPRSVRVTLALLPFCLSFIRDWRRFFLFGGGLQRSEGEHRQRAERLRDTMARLGPSFIKAAQLLAMREDIILPLYARELRKLQDQVPPFDAKDARRVLEQSLGRPIREVFSRFEREPIAAASLGQVHRAVHKGQAVAVKIQRPGVRELVAADMRAVRFLFSFLRLFLDENLLRSASAIFNEYERMIARELDFRLELATANRLRHNCRNDPRIRIPVFYEELTTREVAVLEFVEGVRVDDQAGIERAGSSPQALVDLLVETYIRMTVVHGFLHADPHPGNLLLDRQRRLVILDYGMAVELPEATRLELLRMVYAVTKRDVDTVVDCYYKLGMADPDINRAVLRDAAETLMNIQLSEDLSPRQMQEIAQQIVETFHRFPIRLPNQFVYVLRAATLIEGIAMYYNPRFNSLKHSEPIVKRMLAEIAFRGEQPLQERVLDGAKEAVLTLREATTIIHRLEREQLQVRIHEADFAAAQRFFRRFLRRLLLGFAAVAFGATGGAFLYLSGYPLLLLCWGCVTTVLLLALAYWPIGRGGSGPYFR